MGKRLQHRAAAIALAAAAALAAGLTGPAAPAAAAEGSGTAAQSCARAGQPAAEIPRAAVRRALTCVVNRMRTRRDRRPVKRQRQLQRVAQRHARVMARRGCLRARCPGQPSLGRRIRASGYTNGAERWRFALNTGCARSSRAMFRTWRDRRYHRRNMALPAFRHIGVGVFPRATASRCQSGWSSFAALFAWRIR